MIKILFRRILFAALAALPGSIFISITAKNVHNLNARFAIRYRHCTNDTFPSQNTSALIAAMPCIFGNKTKTAPSTNAIMTTARYTFQNQVNLTSANDCSVQLNLPSLNFVISSANIISLTNSLFILRLKIIPI